MGLVKTSFKNSLNTSLKTSIEASLIKIINEMTEGDNSLEVIKKVATELAEGISEGVVNATDSYIRSADIKGITTTVTGTSATGGPVVATGTQTQPIIKLS